MTIYKKYPVTARVISLVFMTLVFLFSIEFMGESFKSMGQEIAETVLLATSNPFIGLFIGLLVTALIQSSSTVTTMIVAMVASGSLSLPEAVPIVMGANIGTTFTSTLVSLAYINKREEFKRAIAAGTIHDFFNILTIVILFPLEYKYGLISWISKSITNGIVPASRGYESSHLGYKLFEILPDTSVIVDLINNPIISIVISFILLFGSIKIIAKVISTMLMGESKDKLQLIIFDKPFRSFAWGTLLTATVQSSSITTSLVVPFAATGKVRLAKVMPFILGANIGTTITAFIAVFFQSEIAISIAVTHLVINIIGVTLFLPIPWTRKLLIRLAEVFGELTMKHRMVGFAYIIIVFFLLPFTLIYSNRGMSEVRELTYVIQEEGGKSYKENVIANITKDRKMPEWLMQSSGNRGNGHIQDIKRMNNILFIDNSFFLIQKPGHCWDDDKTFGKFKLCITEIRDHMKINDKLTVDSVYVYTKEYYEPSLVDSISYKYYISVPQKLLIRTEKISKDHKLLHAEQLIEVN